MPRVIGESISDAIDWTQDKLRSTRPLAESVLFSLLTDKKVRETEQGFVLLEDEDEDDLIKRKNAHMTHRPRFNFATRRKGFVERQRIMQQRLKSMGFSDEAEEMLHGPRDPRNDGYHLPNPLSLDDSRRLHSPHLPPGWVI